VRIDGDQCGVSAWVRILKHLRHHRKGIEMTSTVIPIVQNTPLTFAAWHNQLCHEFGWEKRLTYLRLLMQKLNAIGDVLLVDEAANLGVQFPVRVRGVWQEGCIPFNTFIKPRNKKIPLEVIRSRFQNKPLKVSESAAGTGFDLLRRYVSWGELKQIKCAMRQLIQEFWE
jgi:uncharacterized protein (DUF2267 family)